MPRAKTPKAPKPPKPPKPSRKPKAAEPAALDPQTNGQPPTVAADSGFIPITPSRSVGIIKADLKRAVSLFKQAADATRLVILLGLSQGPLNVTEICGAVSQSQPAVSHHLALMRFGGLIEPDRRGKHNYYDLTPLGRMLVQAARAMIG